MPTKQSGIPAGLQPSAHRWTKDSTNRTVLEVVANNINFCGSKADNAGALSAPAEGPRVGAPAPEYSRGPGDDFAMIEDEGDLPF